MFSSTVRSDPGQKSRWGVGLKTALALARMGPSGQYFCRSGEGGLQSEGKSKKTGASRKKGNGDLKQKKQDQLHKTERGAGKGGEKTVSPPSKAQGHWSHYPTGGTGLWGEDKRSTRAAFKKGDLRRPPRVVIAVKDPDRPRFPDWQREHTQRSGLKSLRRRIQGQL